MTSNHSIRNSHLSRKAYIYNDITERQLMLSTEKHNWESPSRRHTSFTFVIRHATANIDLHHANGMITANGDKSTLQCHVSVCSTLSGNTCFVVFQTQCPMLISVCHPSTSLHLTPLHLTPLHSIID